jgi:ribosome-binding protein aMBF1 (putative translation factor)
MFHQDWEPVVIHNKKTLEAHRPKSAPPGPRKVEKNLEGFDHKKVPKSMAGAIQKKRLELGMTQAKLAQIINEKPAVVNDVECMRGVYNHVHVNKILKALGLTLGQLKNPDERI